jgi:ribonuclease R
MQAQTAIDGRADDDTGPLIEPVLKPSMRPTKCSNARHERQPLDLDLPERKILLKADGTVDRVITPERLEAHRLIEEFMILANVAAAETLERARSPLIYRVHDEPGMEKVQALREFLATLDIPFAKGGVLKPEAFNHILSRVKGRDAEQLVNEVVLRTQAQAEYASENYGHFGLNLRRYAHFTSPIRRYADLIVHRGLIRALKLGHDGLPDGTDQKAPGGGQRADFRHRAPRHAGRARDERPPDRAFPLRSHRCDLRGPDFRCHPRRSVREIARDGRRRICAGAHHR